MKISTHIALSTLALLAIPVFATAEVTATDTGLANGTYFGTGNANTGWTTTTDGNLELGLGALIRYVGPASETGNNYYVPAGSTTVAGKTGSAWGFDYSVDTNVSNTATPPAYTYLLSIYDHNTGQTATFDPSAIPDNSTKPGGGGFQNAEAPSFGFISSQDTGYDMNAADTYDITLTATQVGTQTADSVEIHVNATPEPATFGLIGFGLMGLAAVARRKRSA